MTRKLVVLWLERDVHFRTSMIRLLVRHAHERGVRLVVRTATTEKQARVRLRSRVDCVLCDVSADANGKRTGLRFVDVARRAVPVFVLTDDLDLVVCVRLDELGAKIHVKRNALTHAGLLANTIINAVEAARARPGVVKPRTTYREHQSEFDGVMAKTFEQHGRNVSAAARAIGMKRTTFQSRLQKLGLR